MAYKDLGTATLVTSAVLTNCVYLEVNGSVRRITLDNLMDVMNKGDEMLLRQVAWGVPIRQDQSGTSWGVIGNTGMRTEYELQCGRYLVTSAGRAAKLSKTNSGIYADGTTLDETKGNVMFIGPRLYYVVKTDATSGITYIWFSQLPIGGHYIGNCNNGLHVCFGAYPGAVVSNTLISRSSQTLYTSGATISTFWSYAQANGSDWGLAGYDHVRYMMMLALGHYGNPNIQACLGNGLCGTGNNWSEAYPLKTGATMSYGDTWSKVDVTSSSVSNACHVNMLGVENFYGLQWMMTQGVYFGSSSNSAQTGSEIYIYEGNRVPSSSELTSHPTGSYRQLTRVTSSGNVKNVILGEYFDLFPSVLGGDSSSYWCDYSWANTTGQLLVWGGSAYYGSSCGLACSSSSFVWSFSYSNCGARLAYYGPLIFVNGKNI
jgi:hypothetical protein